MPVAGQIPLSLFVIEGEEEGDVNQTCFKTVPFPGGMELPGPFGCFSWRHLLLRAKIVCHGQVGGLAVINCREKFRLHRLMDEIVTESEETGPLT